MKILVISDVIKWEGYEKIVDENQPDVIVLAGDLTSDGFASFWSEAIEQIPEYQDDLKKLNISFKRKGNITFYQWVGGRPKKYENKHILDIVDEVKKKYENSKEFLNVRKRIHVDKFYQFLEFAGKKSQILVVKGDHDEDFEGDYVPERIDKIDGCKEISGKCVVIDNLSFLGLGYNETHHVGILNSFVEKFKGKVDVVITHCEQGRLPIISLLKPKIIIRGHFGSGKYLVNDIPSVFTMGVKYTIIELENKKLPKITQYITDLNNNIKILEKGSCRPWFSRVSEFERYPWLKPYPV
jgi:predicted phosphodiesterase